MIDAATDEHLWAETFDRELTTTNIFSIQTEIATAIAAALHATLSADEQKNIASVPTENLEAYEAYQLGKQALERSTTRSAAQAIELLETATRIDPDFALAWAGLADSYRALANLSSQDVEEMHEKAFLAIDRALELDGQNSEIQTSFAGALRTRNDLAGAMAAIEKALELNPNSADAHQFQAILLHISGQPRAALDAYEKAASLDPLSPTINDSYAFTLAEVGRFDEALARYRKVDAINPHYPYTAVGIGTIYGLAYGRLDLANQWYRKALALDPGNPFLSAILGLVFLELNDDETAEYWINRSLTQAPEEPWANGSMTMFQSYAGGPTQLDQFATITTNLDPHWRMGTALSHGRVPDFRAGRFERIMGRYRTSFPEIFLPEPEINAANYRSAIDVAGVLMQLGDDDRATLLLEECEKQIADKIRVGLYGYWVTDIQVMALQGKTTEALSALRQAVDQQWRTDWRYFFYVDPNLDSIRDESRFQAILSEIEADMAEQLERVREMESQGELAPIPALGG